MIHLQEVRSHGEKHFALFDPTVPQNFVKWVVLLGLVDCCRRPHQARSKPDAIEASWSKCITSRSTEEDCCVLSGNPGFLRPNSVSASEELGLS
jgi:hypothetical protein